MSYFNMQIDHVTVCVSKVTSGDLTSKYLNEQYEYVNMQSRDCVCVFQQ